MQAVREFVKEKAEWIIGGLLLIISCILAYVWWSYKTINVDIPSINEQFKDTELESRKAGGGY